MATEKTGTIKYKDGDGNLYILYPLTKAEQIEGLEDKIKTLAAAQVGATAPKAHTHAAGDITSGTFAGAVVAVNDTAYTTYKLRNAALVSSVPSSIANGALAFVYG